MIRILVVDDHPAIRVGLHALLRAEPGLIPVAVCASVGEALEVADSQSVDVALLDFHLPDGNGIPLARRLRRRSPAPAVVLYSANPDSRLRLAAALSGIHSLLPKSSGAERLYGTIREAASSAQAPLRCAVPALLREAGGQLAIDDLPLVGMVCDGSAAEEIGEVLGLPASQVEERIESIVDGLSLAAAAGYPDVTARSAPA